MCIVSLSLSSLSLSSGKKKNKAKKVPQPTTGPYVRSGRLYYNAKEEMPLFGEETVEDPQYYLVGASGLREIYFASMDQDIKGKGPGTHHTTDQGRHAIKDSLDDSSIIVLGRIVKYDAMMAATVTTPKSPGAPVTDEEFGVEGEEVVGKA